MDTWQQHEESATPDHRIVNIARAGGQHFVAKRGGEVGEERKAVRAHRLQFRMEGDWSERE